MTYTYLFAAYNTLFGISSCRKVKTLTGSIPRLITFISWPTNIKPNNLCPFFLLGWVSLTCLEGWMNYYMRSTVAPTPWRRRFGDMSFSFWRMKVSGKNCLRTKPTWKFVDRWEAPTVWSKKSKNQQHSFHFSQIPRNGSK